MKIVTQRLLSDNSYNNEIKENLYKNANLEAELTSKIESLNNEISQGKMQLDYKSKIKLYIH